MKDSFSILLYIRKAGQN